MPAEVRGRRGLGVAARGGEGRELLLLWVVRGCSDHDEDGSTGCRAGRAYRGRECDGGMRSGVDDSCCCGDRLCSGKRGAHPAPPIDSKLGWRPGIPSARAYWDRTGPASAQQGLRRSTAAVIHSARCVASLTLGPVSTRTAPPNAAAAAAAPAAAPAARAAAIARSAAAAAASTLTHRNARTIASVLARPSARDSSNRAAACSAHATPHRRHARSALVRLATAVAAERRARQSRRRWTLKRHRCTAAESDAGAGAKLWPMGVDGGG